MEELFYNPVYLLEVNLAHLGPYIISLAAGVTSIITLWLKSSFDSKTKITIARIEAASKVKDEKLDVLENKSNVSKGKITDLEEKAKEDDKRIQELEEKTRTLLEDLKEEREQVKAKNKEIEKLLGRIDKLETRLDNFLLKETK